MKKLFSVLLVLVLTLSVAACAPKDKVRELKISGDKIEKARAVEILQKWEKTVEDADEIQKGQWYKFDGAVYVEIKPSNDSQTDSSTSSTEFVEELISTVLSCTIKGKMYQSPFAFETKLRAQMTVNSLAVYSTKDGTREEKTSAEVEITVLEGKSYVKTVAKTENEDGSSEIVNYGSDDDVLGEYFSDSLSVAFAYTEILDSLSDDGEIYEISKGLLVSQEMKNEQGEVIALQRAKVKVKNDGLALNSASTYLFSVEEADGQRITTKLRVNINSALFGSVKEPDEAWKY